MTDTTFVDNTTVIVASWLNDVNDATYTTIPIHTADILTNTTNIANHIADTSAAHAASAISNTPAGTIVATDVQAAINELDTETVKLAGNQTIADVKTFTSPVGVAAAVASGDAVQLGQAGHAVQVVHLNYGTQTTTTSATPVSTPFTITITPKFASSKILLQWSLGDVYTTSGANGVGIHIYKNGVALAMTAMRAAYVSGTTIRNNGAGIYVDLPATTSATTYTIYFDNGGSGTAGICYESSWGALVATEITV